MTANTIDPTPVRKPVFHLGCCSAPHCRVKALGGLIFHHSWKSYIGAHHSSFKRCCVEQVLLVSQKEKKDTLLSSAWGHWFTSPGKKKYVGRGEEGILWPVICFFTPAPAPSFSPSNNDNKFKAAVNAPDRALGTYHQRNELSATSYLNDDCFKLLIVSLCFSL